MADYRLKQTMHFCCSSLYSGWKDQHWPE